MPGSLTAPFPYDVPVSPETFDRDTGKKIRSPYFAQEHIDWWLEQQRRVEDGPEQLGTVSLSAQSADIAATPVPMPDLTAGMYRVSYYVRVTRAGSVSGEIQIQIGWTDGTIALTSAGTNLTANTTSTFEQRTLFLAVAANVSITYEAIYNDGGGTAMQYKLEIVVEKLPD